MIRNAIVVLFALTPIVFAQQHKAPAKKAAAAPADKPAPNNLSPVGHWVVRGNPNNDLQLWFDFHADGTLTLTAGATAHSVFKLSGGTLTLGVSSPKVPAGVFDIHFANSKLYSTPRAANPPTLEYTRIGAQRYTSAPLIGKWQITDAPHAADPQQEAIRNRLIKTITSYNPDGTYEVRVPADTTEGTWNDKAHTYTLKGYETRPYQRIGTTLILASPVGAPGDHTYVPDNFY